MECGGRIQDALPVSAADDVVWLIIIMEHHTSSQAMQNGLWAAGRADGSQPLMQHDCIPSCHGADLKIQNLTCLQQGGGAIWCAQQRLVGG